MTKRILGTALVVLTCAVLAYAQQQAPAVAKQPQPKSKAEVEAIQAMFNAQDPDTRIAAAENLLAKFADTEFKGVALLMAAMSCQQKNDIEKMMVYAERTLEADPKSYNAMLMLATAISQRTREHDLDREEKLQQAEKYAKGAMALISAAAKPNPSIPDDQWEGARKDMTSQAHEALGMANTARKKWDVAIAEYKLAIETAATIEPATFVRLGDAYHQSGKYDEAIVAFDKVLNNLNAAAQIKQFAQSLRVRSLQVKGALNKPAATTTPAPAATPATPAASAPPPAPAPPAARKP